tara:strand:- start:355 stop:504 length:150 start_codon:yes stop_codon:yes gene_type:complete
MSNPSLSGGGGITLEDVLVFLWGSSKTGASTENGSGLRYMDTNVSTESV